MSVDKLAIFGGKPAFASPLHVGTPNLGDAERFMQRVRRTLERRLFTNRGPYVRALESKIAEKLDVKHCIMMSNGTAAIEIAARALEMKGAAIVPALTFVATPHALAWQRVTPQFADCERHSHAIDPLEIPRLVGEQTTGVVPVNLWGKTVDVDRVEHYAAQHGLAVIYDSSHAFGCSYRGRYIGGNGDAEVFSFHGTKFVNTFEGGAVTTNNDDLAEKIRLMQNFGFEDRDKVIHIGINGKMNEVEAAMGLTSLESMDEFIARNYENYCAYREGMDRRAGISMMTYDEDEKNNYQYIVLEVDEDITGISRDVVMTVLHSEGVDARRYFYPGCHKMAPYAAATQANGIVLGNTDTALERVLTLPTGTAVTPSDVHAIVGLIDVCLDKPSAVLDALAHGTDAALGLRAGKG